MTISRLLLKGMGVLALTLTLAGATAWADFQVTYSIGGTGATVTDQGAGDLDLTPGSIVISTTVNSTTLTLGANSNRLSTDPGAQVQQVTLNLQNTGSSAQSVTLFTTDTGFTKPGAGGSPVTLVSTLGISTAGTPPISGTFQSFADNSNAAFGTSISAPPHPVVFPIAPGDEVRTTSFVRSDVYSISNRFDLTAPGGMTAAASFTGNTQVFSAVPVPGNIVLLASSMPFLGLFGWVIRRRRSPVAA